MKISLSVLDIALVWTFVHKCKSINTEASRENMQLSKYTVFYSVISSRPNSCQHWNFFIYVINLLWAECHITLFIYFVAFLYWCSLDMKIYLIRFLNHISVEFYVFLIFSLYFVRQTPMFPFGDILMSTIYCLKS